MYIMSQDSPPSPVENGLSYRRSVEKLVVATKVGEDQPISLSSQSTKTPKGSVRSSNRSRRHRLPESSPVYDWEASESPSRTQRSNGSSKSQGSPGFRRERENRKATSSTTGEFPDCRRPRRRSSTSTRSRSASRSESSRSRSRSRSGSRSRDSSKGAQTFDSDIARRALESHFIDDCEDFEDLDEHDDTTDLSPNSVQVSPSALNNNGPGVQALCVEKTSEALMKCSSHQDPLYRKVVFNIIARMNSTLKCNRTQRDLVLDSVSLICSDNSIECDIELREALDNVLLFLCTAFKDLLCRESSSRGGDYLKMIIQLVGSLDSKSEYYRSKIRKRHVLQKMADEVVKRLSADSVAMKATGTAAHNMIEVTMKSLLMNNLMREIKTVLTSISESLSVQSSERYSATISHLISKYDVGVLLFDYRKLIKSLLVCEHYTSIQTEIFQNENFIPYLLSEGTENADLGSHVLKIIIMLGDVRLLRKLVVEDYCTQFGDFILSFLRSDEESVEGILVKFWLIHRLCKSKEFRDVLFCTEDLIVQIMVVMRAVSLDVGEDHVLRPFYEVEYFRNEKLTTTDVILHLVDVYECEHSSGNERQCASDILMSFATGLRSSCGHTSSRISKAFIDSGIIAVLMHVLCEENNSGDAEAKERALRLIIELLVDVRIREVFLAQPLLDLHSLVNSYHRYEQRSNAAASLVQIVQVLAQDPLSHPKLFESDVVIDLVDFIKRTLTTSCTLVPQRIKISHILQCLSVLELMASVEESQKHFQKMKMEDFLKLLLRHESKAVRDVVSQVLERIGVMSDRVPWKSVFKEATVRACSSPHGRNDV